MALRDDVVVIQKAAGKILVLLDLKDTVTTANIDPSRDTEGELNVTLTAGQKQQLQAAFLAAIQVIKTKAAGLP